MGEISKKVRYGLMPGPNQKKFDRKVWEALTEDEMADEDDKRILAAGILFDDILSGMRGQVKLSKIGLPPDSIARTLIALGTFNLIQIHKIAERPLRNKKDKTFYMSCELGARIQAQGGEFTPDELLTGFGDGLKHMLRELLGKPITGIGQDGTKMTIEQLNEITYELNTAISYQCIVEYWNDCAGNFYGIEIDEHGVLIRPYDKNLEIARIVSSHRRSNYELSMLMDVLEHWHHKFPAELKKSMCEFPLVEKIHGIERVQKIDLGKSRRVINDADRGVAAKLLIEHGYYKPFLHEPLPKFNNLTLSQLISGWRLLQSMAHTLLESAKRVDIRQPKDFKRLAPLLPKSVLIPVFSKALSVDSDTAGNLIDTFTYTGDMSQDLWQQPLVGFGDDLCLVLPCIHAVHLLRLIEGWMRQGGIRLERRGGVFEKYCRDEIKKYCADSSIKKSLSLVMSEVEFTPMGGSKEEIDIVLFLGETTVLIEAKCILWPDECLQFANYRDTIKEAAEQIRRKELAVKSDYSAFRRRVEKLGYTAPEECKVVSCVLTNSAVYSGFPIDGIPIVDLLILRAYLNNIHIRAEVRRAGEAIISRTIKFYEGVSEAEENLASYLHDLPQLTETKKSIEIRDIFIPGTWSGMDIRHRTYHVNFDEKLMMKKYDLEQVDD